MNVHHNSRVANSDNTYLEIYVITHAILDLLESDNMRTGDAIDINVTEHVLGLRGINEKDFRRGFAQLMNQGVIDYIGSRLCLTRDDFKGLKQAQEGGN